MEAIKKKILEKPEPKAEEKTVVVAESPPIKAPPQATPPPKPKPPAITSPVEKPKEIKPLIDIAGNPKYAESRGLEQWARLQNLKNSAHAFMLMQEYGGLQVFNKLYSACKTDIETITNAIEANKERLTAYKYLRKDVADFHRTKDIYKQYREIKNTFFQDRFRRKHEDEIIEHENAALALRDYERPLPKIKDIDERIERLKAANVTNNKSLAIKKKELNQLKNIHAYLHEIKREHEPPTLPREQTRTRKRSNDLDR